MSIFQILLIAVSVALDAFAVSLARGIAMPATHSDVRVINADGTAERPSFLATSRRWLTSTGIVGLWFGAFQLAMALIGYAVGDRLPVLPAGSSRWIVGAIFVILAALMVREAMHPARQQTTRHMFSAATMAPLALATSIDSLAVGVTLALTGSDPWLSGGLIGMVTFVLSAVGFLAGTVVGSKFEKTSQMVGAGILLLVGLKVLLGF